MLFHKRSYAAVTVEEVIEASEVSRAEFYRNFSNKSAIGLAWLQRLQRGMLYMQEELQNRPVEASQKLRRYFAAMQNWMETNNFRSCQFANTAACIDPEEEPQLAEFIDSYKRAQRNFMIELVGAIVGPEDSQRLGSAVYLLFSGAMTESQNLKASWPLQDALKVAEQLCDMDSRP